MWNTIAVAYIDPLVGVKRKVTGFLSGVLIGSFMPVLKRNDPTFKYCETHLISLQTLGAIARRFDLNGLSRYVTIIGRGACMR